MVNHCKDIHLYI